MVDADDLGQGSAPPRGRHPPPADRRAKQDDLPSSRSPRRSHAAPYAAAEGWTRKTARTARRHAAAATVDEEVDVELLARRRRTAADTRPRRGRGPAAGAAPENGGGVQRLGTKVRSHPSTPHNEARRERRRPRARIIEPTKHLRAPTSSRGESTDHRGRAERTERRRQRRSVHLTNIAASGCGAPSIQQPVDPIVG
mmetsp:Transcript_4010/g.16039  ORF Transcript_4010/g.16039 Transcript_4010/m.16039 type:complete len:197 (-) Transcript_4010:264-854(-)